MATKNMAYDHPQYVVNVAQGAVLDLAGATAAKGRAITFTAFADTIVRAVHWSPLVAGTSTAAGNFGNIFGIHVRNSTGVTGGTSTLAAAGNALATGLVGTAILSTATLSRGDCYKVLSTGTDATGLWGVSIEGIAVPGASVTS